MPSVRAGVGRTLRTLPVRGGAGAGGEEAELGTGREPGRAPVQNRWQLVRDEGRRDGSEWYGRGRSRNAQKGE